MAELTTIARPYAKAAFEVALKDGSLPAWSDMLGLMASVANQATVRAVLTDPALSSSQTAQALIDVCGDGLQDKGQNFVRLLADNKRLQLLSEISQLFEILKAEQEKSVDVEITTAFEISSEIAARLASALGSRLQREINLDTTVDRQLIGGAIIRAGDTVIDSSVRGKLSKLAESISA